MASWNGEVEISPRWCSAGDRVRGYWECGLGLSGRIGLADGSPGAFYMGAAGHTSLGMELGSGSVRPIVAMRAAFTATPGSVTGAVALPEGTVSWSFFPGGARVVLQAGAAFGER